MSSNFSEYVLSEMRFPFYSTSQETTNWWLGAHQSKSSLLGSMMWYSYHECTLHGQPMELHVIAIGSNIDLETWKASKETKYHWWVGGSIRTFYHWDSMNNDWLFQAVSATLGDSPNDGVRTMRYSGAGSLFNKLHAPSEGHCILKSIISQVTYNDRIKETFQEALRSYATQQLESLSAFCFDKDRLMNQVEPKDVHAQLDLLSELCGWGSQSFSSYIDGKLAPKVIQPRIYYVPNCQNANVGIGLRISGSNRYSIYAIQNPYYGLPMRHRVEGWNADALYSTGEGDSVLGALWAFREGVPKELAEWMMLASDFLAECTPS